MSEIAPPRSNRRLTARRACHLTVRYRSEDDWHPAMALDMSRNGCRLRLGEDLPRGLGLIVRIEHAGPAGSGPLEAEVPGRVIWSRPEGLSYQAGIQFGGDSTSLNQLLSALA
jgi:hypothetical protein